MVEITHAMKGNFNDILTAERQAELMKSKGKITAEERDDCKIEQVLDNVKSNCILDHIYKEKEVGLKSLLENIPNNCLTLFSTNLSKVNKKHPSGLKHPKPGLKLPKQKENHPPTPNLGLQKPTPNLGLQKNEKIEGKKPMMLMSAKSKQKEPITTIEKHHHKINKTEQHHHSYLKEQKEQLPNKIKSCIICHKKQPLSEQKSEQKQPTIRIQDKQPMKKQPTIIIGRQKKQLPPLQGGKEQSKIKTTGLNNRPIIIGQKQNVKESSIHSYSSNSQIPLNSVIPLMTIGCLLWFDQIPDLSVVLEKLSVYDASNINSLTSSETFNSLTSTPGTEVNYIEKEEKESLNVTMWAAYIILGLAITYLAYNNYNIK